MARGDVSALANAIRDVKGLLCLQCPFEDGYCNENDPRCPYRIRQSRKQYYRDYYQQNRDKKIAAAKARNAALGEQYLEYQREYRQRVNAR